MGVKDEIRTNLKDLMVTQGFRNVDLARALGVSKVAVTNWLNGSNSISIERIIEICDLFDVSIDSFLNHRTTWTSLDDQEAKLINLYRMTNDAGKQTILSAARHSLANGGQRISAAPRQDGA